MNRYQATLAAFDQANAQDPNQEIAKEITGAGKKYPKELLYAQRMSEMQQRYAPDASEELKLAVRAQHIQRWKIPRSNYPMERIGYLQWRTTLYKFHAETARQIMQDAGYDETTISRVKAIISKKGIKINPDTQLLEDVANLVFIEHYMTGFAAQHPEYDEAKWRDIIRKIWKKMSPAAQRFALEGKIKFPEALTPLILKAIQ